MHLLQMVPKRLQTGLEHRIGLPEGEEHFRAGRRELAVAEIGDLGVVHPTEIQGFGQGRQHLVRPPVALMPDVHEVRHRPAPLGQTLSVTTGHRVRIKIGLNHLIRILIACSLSVVKGTSHGLQCDYSAIAAEPASRSGRRP